MKFQKLTIHNIASIEDAVIDFEAQPLADSEVFLITGNTGAGKSTILDAICLALYASTPRLSSTKMQGEIKDGDRDVTLKDPRQLMRRNTGEAFVTLAFTGSNGIPYEATWSVARARKKATGNIQSKDWQLKNLSTNSILEKDTEIKDEIVKAIGLDFNQFCRTTMLAQGEFTRFLNSGDGEKAEILEKITGVDIYSRIGAKVFEVTNQKKQAWEESKRLVDGVLTLSAEEIAAKKEKIEELVEQQKNLKISSDNLCAKRDWIRTDNDLHKGVTEADDALRTVNETIESENFKTQETLLTEWRTTIEARGWLTELDKAKKDEAEQHDVLKGLAENFAEVRAGLVFAEQETALLEKELQNIDNEIAAETGNRAVYENVQTIVGYLTTIEEGNAAMGKEKKMIEEEKKKLSEKLQPALLQAEKSVTIAKEELEKEENKVKEMEEATASLHLNELRTQLNTANELLSNINTAKERLDTLATCKAQYEKSQKELSAQSDDIAEAHKALEAMVVPIAEAKCKMETRKEMYDKQSATIEGFAKTLRTKLHIGDVCPVCRQTIQNSLPLESELSRIVEELKDAFDKAEKNYKEINDKKIGLEASIKAKSEVYNKQKKTFDSDRSVDIAIAKAMESCNACGIKSLDDTTTELLDKLSLKTNDDKNIVAAKIKEGEAMETLARNKRKAIDEKRKELDHLTAKVANAQKDLDASKNRIDKSETLLRNKQHEVDSATDKVAAYLTADNWSPDWKCAPKEFAQTLLNASKQYGNNINKQQTLAFNIKTAKTNLSNVTSTVTSILSAMPSWEGAIDASKIRSYENLQSKANSINASLASALARQKSAQEKILTNQNLLNAFMAEQNTLTAERMNELNKYTSAEIQEKEASLAKIREAVVSKQTLLNQAKRLLDEHQQKRPDLAKEETLDSLTLIIEDFKQQIETIMQQQGAINQELKTDQDNKEKLSALIADSEHKKEEHKKWDRMNQLIGDSTGKKFRMIAQSYVLANLIHSANSYMRTLTDRYTLKVAPGTFVISIEDAYQGFASRAASTISGGESFLVSLSLALALSDIDQSLSADTLFIDEGFGTLSGEPLQNAINTLRSLHTKAGRHVGIISHVEELQERIPIQIQVIQEGRNSNSKVKIVPEVAQKNGA